MNTIQIVGAGFSGLSLAYQLRKRGMAVSVVEKSSQPGGLISTKRSDLGLAESAANAILADAEIERLFEDLKVPFASQLPERKKRFVFWERPRRWPLSGLTTAKMVLALSQARFGNKAVMPKEFESVADWSLRVVNAEFEQRLLSPALQGVFAGDPKRLSATLTLSSLLGGGAARGKLRGSVAPEGGMNQLITALRETLEKDGVQFRFDQEFQLEKSPVEPVVLCTSAWAAADLTAKIEPQLSEQLRHCESLPLVSVTCFFETSTEDLKGFGCLFPPSQGFQANGVIFNDCVFSGRSKLRSETWIFGGALQLGAAAFSDEQLRDAILKDRSRLMASKTTLLEMNVTRWPRAIPHYTVQWERFVRNLEVPKPLFLHGNYLGGIGLSRIYQRSIKLANELQALYGS